MPREKDGMELLMERLMDPTPKREGGISNEELMLHAVGIAGQSHTRSMVGRLDYYFNTVLKIDAAKVGWFTGISRIWDGINDPMVGTYIDNHRFKNGEKLRPYLKITAPFVGIFSTLLFVNFGLPPTATMLLMLVIYLLYDTFYSFQSVALWGMTAMMSPHSSERSRAAQWARIGSSVGGLLPGMITPALGYRDQMPFGLSGMFFFLALFFCFGGSMLSMTAAGAKERVPTPPNEDSFLKNLWVLRSNRILIMLALAAFLDSLSPALDGIYLYQEMNYTVLGKPVPGEMIISVIGAFTSWPGAIAMFMARKAAKSWGGMRNVLIAAKLSDIAVRFFVYFVGYRSVGQLIVGAMLSMAAAVPGGMVGIANTALWGDSVDYLEWKTGKRTEGIAFSTQNFLGKIGGGISSVIKGQILKRLLFDGSLAANRQPQGPIFQKWAWGIHTLGPILGSFLSLLPLLCIRYSKEQKQQVEAELAERRALAAEQCE